MKTSILCGILWAALVTHATAGELRLFEQAQRHMGTSVTIKLYAADEQIANQAMTAAFDRIRQLDRIMSDYDETSELSRLSASSPTKTPVVLSLDLWSALEKSQKLSEASHGAFDITVGPLTKLWRRARRQKELPSPERMAEARAAVGYQNLRLDPQQHTAELLLPKMRLDLGGIGQGIAADEALAILRKKGVPQAIVDVSGDIAFGDPPPGEKGWQTGIAPLEADAPPSRILRLANCAISTSGDAFQFVEIDGKRYSHIVDPATGLGLTVRSSVSILAKDCTTADALATAACVLGPEKSLELISKFPTTSCLIVYQREGKVISKTSENFPKE